MKIFIWIIKNVCIKCLVLINRILMYKTIYIYVFFSFKIYILAQIAELKQIS